MKLYDQMHADWKSALAPLRKSFDVIEVQIQTESITPAFEDVMRALTVPIDSIRVVIFGQDPYPKAGYAHGLAFSVPNGVHPLPASLRNIFKELDDDCGERSARGCDLSLWADQGVLLINRILTTRSGESLTHRDYGWQVITDEVARILGQRQVVAILWGKFAQELAPYFRSDFTISSVHPSPLSAYRGFFGSKPFSTANQVLLREGLEPIQW
ncbi:unannotated protein [freshwater metagenome]|uniref:Unannotated protein n=1 Tax=freshwater metagenome TaxID=449393 RepID=A0A6J7LS53_9ZZZZ|nr:uracil-DNA glycosylase [Actinomycetota bacterium]MSW62484.1 uracil-DNA glycosylase [Actinomycetota bacterium]MSX89515.1 uracil-DNA glycosylase [Actinomycetota bacterium]MSZ63862.1 uracil-DNA glycosylase [Actinomycetota bacterium]MTA58143.1 uracil-DNA glycosylase [Actinomycetota bacterium]